MTLAGLGSEIGHLPEQPLIDCDTSAFVIGVEPAGLAAEILQDCTRLENRYGATARTIRIDDRGHAVVRRDLEKIRLELLALGNVDRYDVIGQTALLEHDRNLPAVRCRPVVK